MCIKIFVLTFNFYNFRLFDYESWGGTWRGLNIESRLDPLEYLNLGCTYVEIF